MLRNRKHLPTYPDGVVGIYAEKDRKSDFNARRNARTLDDMDLVVTLCYEERSCREQDFEFAEQSGFTLSRKVKTPRNPEVDPNMRAVIGRDLYDVSYVEPSRNDMYLYLQSAGEIAGGRP